jgi:hypothetical protein
MRLSVSILKSVRYRLLFKAFLFPKTSHPISWRDMECVHCRLGGDRHVRWATTQIS